MEHQFAEDKRGIEAMLDATSDLFDVGAAAQQRNQRYKLVAAQTPSKLNGSWIEPG